MKRRVQKKRTSRSVRTERREYVHAQGCVVENCASVDAYRGPTGRQRRRARYEAGNASRGRHHPKAKRKWWRTPEWVRIAWADAKQARRAPLWSRLMQRLADLRPDMK